MSLNHYEVIKLKQLQMRNQISAKEKSNNYNVCKVLHNP